MDGFWRIHDLVYEHPRDGDEYEERVKSIMSGVRSGVNSTPPFFVNGQRFGGDWTDASAFAGALERAAR